MTRDRYLSMCEQMGKEPDENEIPPDWEDFPDTMQIFVARVERDNAYIAELESEVLKFLDEVDQAILKLKE
jgi:hypothetical protein